MKYQWFVSSFWKILFFVNPICLITSGGNFVSFFTFELHLDLFYVILLSDSNSFGCEVFSFVSRKTRGGGVVRAGTGSKGGRDMTSTGLVIPILRTSSCLRTRLVYCLCTVSEKFIFDLPCRSGCWIKRRRKGCKLYKEVVDKSVSSNWIV